MRISIIYTLHQILFMPSNMQVAMDNGKYAYENLTVQGEGKRSQWEI
jgi:hypothetical protein